MVEGGLEMSAPSLIKSIWVGRMAAASDVPTRPFADQGYKTSTSFFDSRTLIQTFKLEHQLSKQLLI